MFILSISMVFTMEVEFWEMPLLHQLEHRFIYFKPKLPHRDEDNLIMVHVCLDGT